MYERPGRHGIPPLSRFLLVALHLDVPELRDVSNDPNVVLQTPICRKFSCRFVPFELRAGVKIGYFFNPHPSHGIDNQRTVDIIGQAGDYILHGGLDRDPTLSHCFEHQATWILKPVRVSRTRRVRSAVSRLTCADSR